MVRVTSIDFSSYEDGSVWLSYVQDDGYGYELRYPSNILEPICENKIRLNQLQSSYLIRDALWSDNEMVSVFRDDEDYEKCCSDFKTDCEKYPELIDYSDVDYDENGNVNAIIIYSPIITKILFND